MSHLELSALLNPQVIVPHLADITQIRTAHLNSVKPRKHKQQENNCFEPLSFEVVYYAAVVNENVSPAISLLSKSFW